MMNDRWTTCVAWASSAVLHAVTLGAALVLAAEFSLIPRPRPFQWDVTLVSAAPSDAITSDLPVSSGGAPFSGPVSPIASAADQPRTGGMTSALQTAPQPGVDLPAADAHSETALLDQMATALLQHTAPELPPLDEILPPTDATDAVPLQAPPDTPPVVADQPETRAVLPVTRPEPTDLPPPDVEAELADQASEPAREEPPRVAYRPAVQELAPVSTRSLHADYGWLVSLLHTRVEQLKRYPHHARTQRWEGQVLLQASIDEDGRVDGITVIESSGHYLLDQEAIALLQRASPVPLAHPLGQSHVVLHIPIAYRLE